MSAAEKGRVERMEDFAFRPARVNLPDVRGRRGPVVNQAGQAGQVGQADDPLACQAPAYCDIVQRYRPPFLRGNRQDDIHKRRRAITGPFGPD